MLDRTKAAVLSALSCIAALQSTGLRRLYHIVEFDREAISVNVTATVALRVVGKQNASVEVHATQNRRPRHTQ